MSRCQHRVLLSSFLLLFAGIVFAGMTALQAQTPSTAQAPSESAPDAQGNQRTDLQQPASSFDSNHGADNAWTNLLRDVEQMGMRKAERSGGYMNAGGSTDSGASMNLSLDRDGNLGSANMRAGSGTGEDIGSSNLNGGISNGFSGGMGNGLGVGARNIFGGNMGTGFRGAMSSPSNFGVRFNLSSLSQLAGDLSRGLNVSGHTNAGTVLGAVPSFNQLMRGGLSLPMNSAFGNFRLTYQSPFSLTNNLQMIDINGYGSGFAAYDSPHAHSGRIDFSASAKVGVGTANGMSNYSGDRMNQGGFGGNHGPGGHGPGGNSNEQPSTSVSFRLAF